MLTWMWSGQAYLAIFLVTDSLSCRVMSDWLVSMLSFSTTKANTAEEVVEKEEEEVVVDQEEEELVEKYREELEEKEEV